MEGPSGREARKNVHLSLTYLNFVQSSGRMLPLLLALSNAEKTGDWLYLVSCWPSCKLTSR